MVFGLAAIYGYTSIVCGLILIGIAAWTYPNRDERGAKALIGMVIAQSGWCIFNGLNILAQTHPTKLFFLHMTFVSVFLIPPFWTLFALKFTDNMQWWTPKLQIPVVGGAIFFILLSSTNQLHFLFMDPRPLITEPFLLLENQPLTPDKPWYVVGYIYAYSVVIAANLLIIRLGLSSGKLHKDQIFMLLIGLFVPMILGVLTAVGLSPHGKIDLVPYGVGVWGIVIGYVYHRHQLFDIAPIARERVVSGLRDPMIIIDHKGRVTDWNPAAEPLFSDTPDGGHLSDVAPEELLAALAKIGVSIDSNVDEGTIAISDGAGSVDEQLNNVSLVVNDTRRTYNMRLNVINKGQPRAESKVVVMRDITRLVDQKQQLEQKKDELQRQNERLDEFAGVLAHDLRNPLATAKGYTDLAVDMEEISHLEEVSRAQQRMDDMIDDVLMLARQGKEVTEEDLEEVGLQQLMNDAWAVVDTPGGTLNIETNQTICADPSRMSNLFENLIRNAFEHVGEGTTMYVGDLDVEGENGFFIADDGPGIPEDKRDRIFEHGYTTNTEGTGFGLSIVKETAESHGWDVQIAETNDSEYGAKFDFISSNAGSCTPD